MEATPTPAVGMVIMRRRGKRIVNNGRSPSVYVSTLISPTKSGSLIMLCLLMVNTSCIPSLLLSLPDLVDDNQPFPLRIFRDIS